MSETLTIEIQDKGGAATRTTAPPRPPAATGAPGPTWPRSPAASAGSGAGASMQPALAPRQSASFVDEILDRLGVGRQVRAFQELFNYAAGRGPLQQPTPSAATQSLPRPPAPPAAVQPATPPQPASSATAQTAIPPQPTPSAAAQPVAGEPFPVESLRSTLEQGFNRVAGILQPVADYFADLPEPGPAAPASEKAAAAPITPPAGGRAHAPASAGLQHPQSAAHPAGPTEEPHAPDASHMQAMPTAAEHGPPQPPLAVPARSPAAGEGAAAEAGEAAELGELAAGAEVAGGALAAVGAVVLPVAAAFVAVEAAVTLTKAAFNEAREVVGFLGQQVADIAGNDYLGMFEHRLDMVEKSLAKVPIVGGMLSSAFGAAVAPVKAFTVATETFTRRAHELAGFSPDIAVAEQMSSVRSLLDDFKEANTLGPDLARLLDAETSLQHDLREIFLPIKKVVVDVLASVLEHIGSTIKDIHSRIAAMQEMLQILVELFNDIFGSGKMKDIPALIGNIDNRIKAAMAKATESDMDDALKKKILGMTRDLLESKWDKGAAADPWAGIPRAPRPAIPLVAPVI